jgi:hypothetical protein
LGWRSLFSDTTGNFNTAVGAGTLVLNTADSNTAVGTAALLLNTSGEENVAIGATALFSNTTGTANTATGEEALHDNSMGLSNTADGFKALTRNTTGTGNTAIGFAALELNTTGNSNVALGPNAGESVTTANNVICIGNVPGANVSDTCYIGNIFTATSASGVPVLVNSNNQLGTATSSKRFKEAIKPMDKASEVLFALDPVTFRYKKAIDPKGTSQFGLVAEEVEKVNPDLVMRDREGKAYTVRYDAVNAMLLNEFLKEHKKVQELQATVAQQQKDFQAAIAKLKETVTTQLNEQAAQIQKVSAQLELNKPAPQTVLNNR